MSAVTAVAPGEVPERLNGRDWKSRNGGNLVRGFESLPLRVGRVRSGCSKSGLGGVSESTTARLRPCARPLLLSSPERPRFSDTLRVLATITGMSHRATGGGIGPKMQTQKPPRRHPPPKQKPDTHSLTRWEGELAETKGA